MTLRITYEDYKNVQTFENLEEAVEAGIKLIETTEILFVFQPIRLCLDVRKIVTGKKIL